MSKKSVLSLPVPKKGQNIVYLAPRMIAGDGLGLSKPHFVCFPEGIGIYSICSVVSSLRNYLRFDIVTGEYKCRAVLRTDTPAPR